MMRAAVRDGPPTAPCLTVDAPLGTRVPLEDAGRVRDAPDRGEIVDLVVP